MPPPTWLAATSAPVTNWPLRLLLVGLVLAVITVVLWAMLRGWRRRADRHAHLPAPPSLAPASADPATAVVDGVYLGSVIAGDWLDRVAAHGLGTRSRVTIEVRDDGVFLDRQGAPSVFIPSADLVGVRRERGIAGKAFEKGAVAVVQWRWGDLVLDSGLRPDRAEDAAALLEVLPGMPNPADTGSERDL
jgi:hypothetical protein